jgi:site-specific DNA-methyltransferase (adenine-specific)
VRLYLGDCVGWMGRLPGGCADLVFADPPFNIGVRYDGYADSLPRDEYLAWTGRWLAGVMRVCKHDASVYVACGTAIQAEVKLLMDAAGFHWRRTLAWHYTFGPAQSGNWTPSWVAIHYATVSAPPGPWCWNDPAVRVPSMRQLRYRDKRANPAGKVPDDVWVPAWPPVPAVVPDSLVLEGSQLNPGGASGRPDDNPGGALLAPADWGHCGWVISPREWAGAGRGFLPQADALLESRVCGTFRERTGHPCQMPEVVTDRIILASSDPGDVVCDPFCGSGTTLASALRLGRCGVGIDLSEEYLAMTRGRLGGY